MIRPRPITRVGGPLSRTYACELHFDLDVAAARDDVVVGLAIGSSETFTAGAAASNGEKGQWLIACSASQTLKPSAAVMSELMIWCLRSFAALFGY